MLGGLLKKATASFTVTVPYCRRSFARSGKPDLPEHLEPRILLWNRSILGVGTVNAQPGSRGSTPSSIT